MQLHLGQPSHQPFFAFLLLQAAELLIARLIQSRALLLLFDAEQRIRRSDGDSRDARLAALTPREQDVMHRVAAGKLNKVIADEMSVSVRTVEVYRARVYAKLAVRSAAELATLLARAPHGNS